MQQGAHLVAQPAEGVMLREVRNARQVPGEPHRRCFFSHQQDLWVWFGDVGAPQE